MAQPKKKNVKYSTQADKPMSKTPSTREKLAKRGIGSHSAQEIATFKAMAQSGMGAEKKRRNKRKRNS